jgi:DNA ligase D
MATRKRKSQARKADPLARYREMRDFARTPEPEGAAAESEGWRYVIQKHAATRLHYDLRLELGGVLKSWAVTKGPSVDPKEKRLAMQTEDHPLDYGGFEGLIPKEEYGGGAVIVWDQGTWVPMEDPAQSLAKGLLKFRLSGEKLGGGWSLIKLKRAEQENAWLLVKERDVFADSERDILVDAPESVLSGRSVEVLAESGTARRRPVGKAPKASALAGARRTALPNEAPRPQLPTLVDAPPSGPGWLHEIKHDGYRTMCRIENGEARLFTRNGHDWTDRYGGLAEAFAALPCKSALVDGEIAVQDEAGHTSFSALQDALAAEDSAKLVFFAFDLPYLDGHDLSSALLIERKSQLEALLTRAEGGLDGIVYCDHVIGKGAAFLDQAIAMGLEGIVSKKVDAPYEPGRSTRWQKIKSVAADRFIVVGYTESDAAGGLAALLVAEETDDGLVYVGRVGTGFTPESAASLAKVLHRAKRKTPAVEIPPGGRKSPRPSRITWVTPRLRVNVAYRARTGAGMLRAAAFKDLADKAEPPRPNVEPVAPKTTPAAKARKRYVSDADLAMVWITNPERRMFGQDGPTKLDLALYYARIGDWIMPHVINRPITLVRCPTGDTKDCFYQRHALSGMPENVRTIGLREEGSKERADYLYIDDAKGLLGLAQFGVVEFHPWGCRVDKPERPDRLVLDIDPDEGLDWRAVTDAAHEIREVLHAAGLVGFVKTTGGKGLHVVVPIERRVPWTTFKGFAHGFVRALAEAAPGRYTINPKRGSRRGRIYLDYLRNTRAATAIGAYSLRARSGVPVALPISWDILDTIDPEELTVTTVPDLLTPNTEDPWAELGRSSRPITKRILEKFKVRK